MIEYTAENHEYKVNKVIKPSVNQILKAEGIIPDFGSFPNAERKRIIGIYVHKAINLYFRDRLDENSLSGEVKDYFMGFKKFATENNLIPDIVERPLYSDRWDFCGTPDYVGAVNGEQTLIDWKCSDTVYSYYKLTLAAYDILQDKNLAKHLIICLSPNDYKAKPITVDKNTFLGVLLTYKYKTKEGLYARS